MRARNNPAWRRFFQNFIDRRSAPMREGGMPANASVSQPYGSERLDAAALRAEPNWIRRAHTTAATHEDIFYCFRLLLGRVPHAEEWPGHSSRAGQDLENVVSSYLTSREFADRGLLDKTYQDHLELVHLPGFSLFASKEDLAVGCHVVSGGSYEPAVSAVLERYVRPGMAVVDIGANVGYLTMLLASLVGSSGIVIAIEPNPE